ncbi:hypothetical protein ACH4Q7_35170 [Streptomyces roseolus]|uniref:hypothetical protein n=1 Tax=Streptomyces roseolus TaxID=67358 RepID=UPI00378EF00B
MSVRDARKARSAVMSIASPRPAFGSWSSWSGSAGSGASNCSGIAACWWATTSYARPRATVVVRSFCRTTALARTARSYWIGTRRICHSPRPDPGLGFGRLAGIGWRMPVRVGRGGRRLAGGEVGRGPPGGVETVGGLPAAYGLRLGDVQAVGGDGGGHDLLVQAGVAAAAAQDEGEVAAGFSEQVPAMEAAAVIHHERGRGDVDGRQGDVDNGRDPGPDRGGRGAGVVEEGGDDVGGDLEGEDRAHLPPATGRRVGIRVRLEDTHRALEPVLGSAGTREALQLGIFTNHHGCSLV